MLKKRIFNKKGFTLVELLVVIAIIGILAAVIAPNAFKAVERGKVAAAEADFKAIKSAALNYYTDTGVWAVNEAGATGFVIKPTASSTAPVITETTVNAWNGPYLERWPSKNPWGGTYTFKKATGTNFSTSSAEERYIELTLVPSTSSDRLKNDLGSDVVHVNGTTVQILISRN